MLIPRLKLIDSRQFALSLAIAINTPVVFAESETLPVYGIVLLSIASVVLGETEGQSVIKTFASPTQKHQLSLLQGRQDDALSLSRIALRNEHSLPVWQNEAWRLQSAMEISYGYWQISQPYHPSHNQDIGLTPMFKWQAVNFPHLYAEVGVGIHYLENVQVKTDNKSTQFQFGDQLALGWENDQLRVGYRYLHISNANIEVPNPATDFHSLELGYRF